jgi:peroxiredoxin
MKNTAWIIILSILLTSCKTEQATDAYVVNGVVKNMPDSTKILLYLYPNTYAIADSTIVLNEKFQFKGKLERPRLATIRIIKTGDSRIFWLENTSIGITGKMGDLNNSVITGSKTQEEAEILLSRKDSIFEEMRLLGALVNEDNMDSLLIINEELEFTEAKINKRFIEEYPNSYESLFRLEFGTMQKLEPEETAEIFSKLNKKLKESDEGKAISDFIKVNKRPKIGEKFVDFEQNDTKGLPVRLSNIMGKYTLLEFWSSSCGPCRAFNPELVEEYNKYKDKGFAILNVSLDTDKEKWLKAIEKDSIYWDNVSDLKGFNNQAALIYGVDAIPENFLIDENGVVIARLLRGEKLKNKLKELFTNL